MRNLLLFLFFLPILSYGQKGVSESKNILPTSTQFDKYYYAQSLTDSDLESMIELMNAYSSKNQDTTILLGDKALDRSKQLSNKALEARTLLNLGYAYGNFGQYKKAEDLILQGQKIFEQSGDSNGVNEANTKLGNLSMRQNNLESALSYFLAILEGWNDKKSKDLSVGPYLNVAWIYFNMNEFDKVSFYVQEANEAANQLGDKRSKMLVKTREATLFMYISEGFSSNENPSENLASQDSASMYMKQAGTSFESALALAKELNDQDNAIYILNNMVVFHSKTGDLKKAYEKAKDAEVFANEFGDKELLIQSKYNLAYILMDLNDLTNAEKYGIESLKLSQEYGLKRKEALANSVLKEIYTTMGNYKKAMVHIEDLFYYEQELGDKERSKAMAEMETKFQTVEKEKQILELEQKNAKIRSNQTYMALGGLLLGLLGFIIFQINKVRKERKAKKVFTEALFTAQETERKRIARDLHDGIGQSLLLIKKSMASDSNTSLEDNNLISTTLDEVRAISRDLHPFQLEQFGLTTAIIDGIGKVENSTDLFISKEIDNIDDVFSKKQEIHYFRVIQEALSNIVKHANANAAKVSIKKVGNDIITNVMDNGNGFDHKVSSLNSKSLGLQTMHERISALGGKLKFDTNEPTGAVVSFVIPKVN